MFGYAEADILGQTLEILMPERYREPHQKGLERLKIEGIPKLLGKSIELHGLRRDGQEFPIELSLSSWQTEEGGFYSSIIRDITERMEAEEILRDTQNQLIVKDKMATLGNLVAGMVHELNSPVGALNSMLDTLIRVVDKMKNILDETFAQAYQDHKPLQTMFNTMLNTTQGMSTSANRVRSIISSLRNFARLDESEYQIANIHEGMDNTLVLLASQIGENVRVHKDYADLPPIYCSPGQLNQVFMHLIRNALQAMSGKGEIHIRTFQKESHAYVQIRDTGVGIPPDKLEKNFDVGFSATGSRVKMKLGLSIDYKIIQEHQGELKIESEVGQGTTVTIRLPLKTGQQEQMGK